jgi:CheY-like chemotaxis protein
MAGSILDGKRLLAVDDEPDVLDTLEDLLTGGYTDLVLDRATDYETGFHMLRSWTYDAVILDIMGVRGFDLLNAAVSLGFPTVMLTANALTVENLKKSIEMGARAYIPKEKMADIDDFLEDVLTLQHTLSLKSSLKRLGSFFNRQFGSKWMEKEKGFWDRISAGDYEPKPVIFRKK